MLKMNLEKGKYNIRWWSIKIGVESTIINLVNKPQVLRLGGIPRAEIKKYLKLNLIFNKKSKLKRLDKKKLIIHLI